MSSSINIDGVDVQLVGDEKSLTPRSIIPPQGVLVSTVPVFELLFRGSAGTMGRRKEETYRKDVCGRWLWRAAGTAYYVPVSEDAFHNLFEIYFDVLLDGFGKCKYKEGVLHLPSTVGGTLLLPKVPVPECYGDIVIHMKPWTRRIQYFCELSDGRLVYVSCNASPYTFKSFRMWLGTPGCMVHYPITNDRPRTRGIPHVECSEFVFTMPHVYPPMVTSCPSIKFRETSEEVSGVCVRKSQLAKYRIVETGEQLSIELTA